MTREAVNSMRRIDRSCDADREGVFASLLATYEEPISRYLYGMVADRELTRDLAQETFLSAYRALPNGEIANLSAWLYRIATNHALMHFRRKRLLHWLPFSSLNRSEQPRAPVESDAVATRDAIGTALVRLEPKDRACLLLKTAGFSSEEIGAQLGCSPAAARTRLSRARNAFRRQYEAEEGS